jgi:8-oxo-dGTP diphosphatase
VGAYGLALVDDRVLLIRKGKGPYTGSWDLPGGGIEHGESPEDAVRRELIEETGLPVTSLALLAVYHRRVAYTLPGGDVEDLQHIGIIYRVEVDQAARLRVEPDGIDSLGARWLHRAELVGQPLSPFAARALGLATE